MMEKVSVNSSFIKSAVYKADIQCLRLEIHDMYYYYYGITRQKLSHFKAATSKGQYFCRFIKGQYRVLKRKVRN